MARWEPKYFKEVLEKEILQYTQQELAEKYNTNQQYIAVVLKKLGIITPKPHERNAKIKITDVMDSIIVGSALGDGHIRDSKGFYPYLRLEHCAQQKDYLQYKFESLLPLMAARELKQANHFDKRSKKYFESYYVQTRTHAKLEEYKNLFYSKQKKVIPENLIELLDPLALAIWYMDDGTKAKRQNQASLCTQRYNNSEIAHIRFVLAKKFGIKDTTVKKSVNDIVFNSVGFNQLMAVISQYQVPCMSYKFQLVTPRPDIQRQLDALATTMCHAPSRIVTRRVKR